MRRVRMLITRIDLQFPVHLFAKLRLRQHAEDGVLDNPGGTLGAYALEALLHQSSGVSREMAVHLFFFLGAAQSRLSCVDHDHVIACIQKWRINRLMLAHQQHSCFAGKLSNHRILGIEDMPMARYAVLGREFRTHRHTSPTSNYKYSD